MSRKWSIFRTLSLICTINLCFDLNIMHAWEIVDLRVYLAKKNHGYSIAAQSYDFCPHLTQLDILDFTLSPIRIGREIQCLPYAGFFQMLL